MSDDLHEEPDKTAPTPGADQARVLRFTALSPGRLFAGRYRILAWLGSGGSGEVYRARDETAGAEIALKFIYPGARDDASGLERLRRELRLVRRLSHPGIVRIHDIGDHDGLRYLVMDLLVGETLRARLRRSGPLPAETAARVLTEVLEALAVAHSEGIVHRDIKPGNVFLAKSRSGSPRGKCGASQEMNNVMGRNVEESDPPRESYEGADDHGNAPDASGATASWRHRNSDGAGSTGGAVSGGDRESERAVLLDFGLARGGGDLTLTSTGQFVGTPDYVSPEQARGDRELDARTDLYSAGILLWEMLAGSPPFTGDSAIEILQAQMTRPLPRPAVALRAAPAWLKDLCTWMLEKDPRRRPPDAGTALDCLVRQRRRGLLERSMRRIGSRARSGRATLTNLAVILTASAAVVMSLFGLRSWLEAQPLPTLKIGSLGVLGVDTRGNTVWSRDFKRGIAGNVPLDPDARSSRHHLVLLGVDPVTRRKFPDEYPHGLVDLDVQTGLAKPFRIEPAEAWRDGVPQAYDHHDNVFAGSCLRTLPWRNQRGPLFLAGYQHIFEFPDVGVVFDAAGAECLRISHPGRMNWNGLSVPGHSGEAVAFAVSGVNNLLGRRAVILCFNEPAVTEAGALRIPPYRAIVEGNVGPRYYTFLSYPGGGDLTEEDGHGAIACVGDHKVVFDLETGIPIEPEERDNLGVIAWQTAQNDLLGALLKAAELSRQGDDAGAAAALESFASGDGLARVHRGVALGRAAELRRRAGDLAKALTLAERAAATEPLVSGHQRLQIDLLARMGRWEEIKRRVAATAGRSHSTDEFASDLFLAALVTGNAAEAERYLPKGSDATSSASTTYVRCKAILLLHQGKPVEAIRLLHNPNMEISSSPDFAFLRALAMALDGSSRPEDALQQLDVAEEGKGMGMVFPFVPLRIFLKTVRSEDSGQGSSGYIAPSRMTLDSEKLEASLSRQRSAGREGLYDLCGVPWGEALAAAAYHTVGDEEAARRHLDAALTAPGNGPFIERIYNRMRR